MCYRLPHSRCFLLAVVPLLLAPSAYGAPREAPRVTSSLTLEPYVFETSEGNTVPADLGRLEVPEDRTAGESRSIHVAFVRLPALSENPGPPIVYLAGGPGSSGIESARGQRWELLQTLRQVGDVLLLEPRGTGLSRPNLICRETWIHPYDQELKPDQVFREIRERGRACAETLEKWGYQVSAYNVREIADDIEDLRQALGVAKVHLLAVSYGSHLALTVLRRHESSVGRAVLVGVVGPDHALKLPSTVQAKLKQIELELGGDPKEGKGFVSTVRRVLGRLEKEPVDLVVNDPQARRDLTVKVGKLDLQLATVRFLGTRENLQKLVAAYEEMDRGDFSTMAQKLRMGKKGWLGSAIPYAIICSSGASPQRWQAISESEDDALLGRLLDFPFPEICPALGVSELGPKSRTPVKAGVPTLMISGTLDIRTPSENALQILGHLPHAHHLLVVGGGHGNDLLLSSPKIPQAIRDFFLDGSVTAEEIVAFPKETPSSPSAAGGKTESLRRGRQ